MSDIVYLYPFVVFVSFVDWDFIYFNSSQRCALSQEVSFPPCAGLRGLFAGARRQPQKLFSPAERQKRILTHRLFRYPFRPPPPFACEACLGKRVSKSWRSSQLRV